ncbi:MAG: hypothetical protein RSE13_02075 [Planktothrix sp. GU0601_MAG3]|nr:MAG: hypothetical protein RSE13_02075 [Planktothrix sp. GU0601_MAG3]
METATLLVAQAFQDFYFKGCYQLDDDVEVVQSNLFETPAKLQYYEKPGIMDEEIFHLIRDEILALDIHPNDLVVLAPTHETVRALEYRFRQVAHERTTHAGETEEEYKNLLKKYRLEDVENPENNREFKRDIENIRRGRKLHFWPNAGTVKLSTIHSFKGWEAHTLVLIICNTYSIEEQGSVNELIYAALTRARKNLVVVDSTGLYREFFGRFIGKGNSA